MTTLLYLLLTLVLVLLNAFFVAAEFALVKMRPTRLEQLVHEGNSTARLALRMSQRLDSYLSATQLGVTLASLGLGWVGEPAIADFFAPKIASLGAWAVPLAHGLAFTIAFLSITALHTILGELAPKSFAIQRTEQITLASARILHTFYLVAWPIIWCLHKGASGFVRLCGVEPAGKDEMMHTSDELRMLLARSPAGLDTELRSMLVRIFDLRRRTARHVMSLRGDAATLRGGMPIDEAVRIAGEAGYSRYPVLDEAGNVLGYLHLRDLFDVLSGRRKASRVAELLRKPIFAKEATSVERLRDEMQRRQIPVAIITSASNEFVGLVTMEDLLEEIVGEIRDENDEEVPPIHRRGGGIVDVDGRLLLVDLERDLGIVLRPEVKTVETLGGYIIARLEHPAGMGERVECDSHTLVVTDVAGRRIRRVRIVPSDGGE
jgi:CBS domain containing-hemolysin-like protein